MSPSSIIITKKDIALIPSVRKRSGDVMPFRLDRIEKAVFKALHQTNEGTENEAQFIAKRVLKDLLRLKRASDNKTFLPNVEMIQDLVEESLMLEGFVKSAKAYILYREERTRTRKEKGILSPQVRQHIKENSQYFRSPYSQFIFYQMYSRWVPELGRRETWTETIDRFMNFMQDKLGNKLSASEYARVREGILRQDICPSMRLLWSAGPPCKESNVWAYNCSYVAPVKPEDLGEIMYVLMCGAGLGFTVESENVQQFPQIQKQIGKKLKTHVIKDSKEGWADAFILALHTWFSGKDIEFDYSLIRPAGARLKTAGGRASGPQPLMDLMQFTKDKIFAKQGKRLSNIDLHDIICQIGLIVVAGGVRRSALISLSELGDTDMRDAKSGQFYINEPQRSMANNSVIYDTKPTTEEFLDEWTALVKSRSGERGIFNRGELERQVPARRWAKIKNHKQIGLNPCGEIHLRSKQFCNLTSIVIRPEDTEETLKEKMELATLIGTYQSMLTDFKYLSKEWKKNCEEEALLGVSLTGYYDNVIIRNDDVLNNLRKIAIQTNKKYAKRFNINESTAITCVKPHGNSGQLLGVGSGMHPWFAQYFIRRVRISATDPLLQFAKDQGVPCFPEVGQSDEGASTFVLEFPVKAPDSAVLNKDVTALALLHEWKRLKINFVEHNPSATIYVGPDEWVAVANFVYENWPIVGGLSFLPRTDHVYKLAPYEEITKEEYNKRIKALGELDFSKLIGYEAEDNTVGSREFACVAGTCEV